MIGCLIFGFLVMVFTHEGTEDMKNPPLHIFIKIMFFIFGTFAIACIFNLQGTNPGMMKVFWAPLALLQAKIFFHVNFSEDV